MQQSQQLSKKYTEWLTAVALIEFDVDEGILSIIKVKKYTLSSLISIYRPSRRSKSPCCPSPTVTASANIKARSSTYSSNFSIIKVEEQLFWVYMF